MAVSLGVNADTGALKSFDRQLQNVRKSMKDVVTWSGKMAAGVAAVFGSLGLLSKVHSEFAEEAVRTSRAFGLSTDRYQELRFAFQSLNASSDDLHDAMTTLNRRTMQAAEGTVGYRRALQDLGLSVEEMMRLPLDEQLLAFTHGVQNAEDSNRALGAAVHLLGSDLGRRLTQGLSDADSSLDRFMKMARDAGLVIEEDLLIQATAAQLEFRQLSATLTGIMRLIGVRVAPAFGRLARSIHMAIVTTTAYIDNVMARLTRVFEEEVTKFIEYFRALDQTIKQVFGGWKPVVLAVVGAFAAFQGVMGGAAFAGLFKAMGKLFAIIGIKTVGAFVLLAAKALLVIAAIVGIILVVEDLIGYFTGADSWIGDFIDRFAEMQTVTGAIARAFRDFFQESTVYLSFFKGAWDLLRDTVVSFFQSAAEQFQRLLPFIVGFVLGVVGLMVLLVVVVGAVLIGILKIFTFLMDVFNAVYDFLDENLLPVFQRLGAGIANALGGAVEVVQTLWEMLKEIPGLLSRLPGGQGGLFGEGGLTRTGAQRLAEVVMPRFSSMPTPQSTGAVDRGGRRGGGDVHIGRVDLDVDVAVPEGADVGNEAGEHMAEAFNDRISGALLSQYALGFGN